MNMKACFWIAFCALSGLTAEALDAAGPYLSVPVKSATISYKVTNLPLSKNETPRTTEPFVTIFISDNGAAVAQQVESPTVIGARNVIIRDGFLYTLENDRKAARKTPLDQSLMYYTTDVPLRRAQDLLVGRGMARGATFKKIGTEQVAGVTADKYESKYPNGRSACTQRDTYSIYKGMVLRAEIGWCNSIITIYEATRYAEDQADASAKTALPEGYKVIDQTEVQASRTAAWAPQSLKVTYDSTVDGGIYQDSGKRIRYITAEKSVELWNATRAYGKKAGLPPEQIAQRTIIDHKEHTRTAIDLRKKTYTSNPAHDMRTASPRDIMVMQKESSGKGDDRMRVKGTSTVLGRECVNMEINMSSTLMEVCSWNGVFLTRTDYACLDRGKCIKKRLFLQETASGIEDNPAMDKELFSIPEGFTRR